MRVTSLGYRTDLALRALEGGTETDRGGYLVVRNPALPDFWWGNFLLLAQPPEPDSAGDWLAAFTAEFPEAQHVAIGLDTASSQDADPAPFVAAGLEYERNLVLTAAPGEVHEPPRPSRAATLRPLTSDGDWQQVLDLRLAAIEPDDPPGTAGFIRSRAAADRRLAEAGHGAWLGALAGGRLVAQLGLFRAGGGLARYQNVVTHPAARGQGLAGTLAAWAARYGGAELGAATLVIVADPEHVAARVYASIGFTPAEEQLGFQRGPVTA